MTEHARELIERIEILDAQATPGTWEALGASIESTDYSCDEVVSTEVHCGSFCLGGRGLGVQRSADAEMLTLSRTALPKLAAALKAALQLADDFEQRAARHDRSDYVGDHGKARGYENAAEDLRKTLAQALGDSN